MTGKILLEGTSPKSQALNAVMGPLSPDALAVA